MTRHPFSRPGRPLLGSDRQSWPVVGRERSELKRSTISFLAPGGDLVLPRFTRSPGVDVPRMERGRRRRETSTQVSQLLLVEAFDAESGGRDGNGLVAGRLGWQVLLEQVANASTRSAEPMKLVTTVRRRVPVHLLPPERPSLCHEGILPDSRCHWPSVARSVRPQSASIGSAHRLQASDRHRIFAITCPYHSLEEWRRLKRRRVDGQPG